MLSMTCLTGSSDPRWRRPTPFMLDRYRPTKRPDGRDLTKLLREEPFESPHIYRVDRARQVGENVAGELAVRMILGSSGLTVLPKSFKYSVESGHARRGTILCRSAIKSSRRLSTLEPSQGAKKTPKPSSSDFDRALLTQGE